MAGSTTDYLTQRQAYSAFLCGSDLKLEVAVIYPRDLKHLVFDDLNSR
jgi:hypothetical protein